jgi:hypothetical protein
MENRIFKYELKIMDEQIVKMPKDAEILTAQFQNNKLILWANVRYLNKEDSYVIEIYGTGNPFPSAGMAERKYISTVQKDDFVWHIFQVI